MRTSKSRGYFHVRPRLLHGLCWVVLVVFAVSCTRQVARGPVAPRRFAVDWEALDSTRMVIDGMVIDGVVLTPAQWPLEASMKKLLELDFEGVIENFDITFRSSTLRGDVLERLYGEGFLPAYLRVSNSGSREVAFDPGMVAVWADEGTLLRSYPPEALPRRFREIDWARTGMTVVLVALTIVLVLAAGKGRGRVRGFGRAADVTARATFGSSRGGRRAGAGARPAGAPRRERGLLWPLRLKPGETREGFVFFRLNAPVTDWRTARIGPP